MYRERCGCVPTSNNIPEKQQINNKKGPTCKIIQHNRSRLFRMPYIVVICCILEVFIAF